MLFSNAKRDDYSHDDYLRDSAAYETNRLRSEIAIRNGDEDAPRTHESFSVCVGSDALPFVRVRSGSFASSVPASVAKQILSTPNRNNDIGRFADQLDRPLRTTEVSQDFFIAEVPVTNRMFGAFVADTGYRTSVSISRTGWQVDTQAQWRQGISCEWDRQPWPASAPDRPVTQVSWFDAMSFAAWLGRRTGGSYRLPTSAEWQLAATPPEMQGQPCVFPWGNEIEGIDTRANLASRELADHIWVYDQYADGHAYTSPVTAYPPNARGLYDLVGNVWEWSSTPMVSASAVDPELWAWVAANGAMAMHGGCYLARLTHMTLYSKMSHPALDGACDIGFRLVCAV